jgi:hypothetical protein
LKKRNILKQKIINIEKENVSNVVLTNQQNENENKNEEIKVNQHTNVITFLYVKKMIQMIPLIEEKKKILDYFIPFYHVRDEITAKIFEWEEGKSFNQEVWKSWKYPVDLYIFSFRKRDPEYYQKMISKLPKFPIYLNEVFYITPILFYLIDGFSNTEKSKEKIIEDFQLRIMYQLGIMIGMENEIKFRKNQKLDIKTGIHDYFPKNSILHDPCVFKIQPWMTRHFKKNDFGWFGKMNQFAIDYVFENYEIDTVAEFGIYMGYSSRYILSKKPNVKYYGFDVFRPIFLTKYTADEILPIDTKFFFKYMRFETFQRNVAEYPNVATIVGDIYENYELLKMYKIQVQFVYIDFEKKTEPLYHFVMKVLNDYPNAVIVGDDYVFESVKRAVENMRKSNIHVVGLDTCYLASKRPFKNIENIIKKYEKHKEYMNETDLDKIKGYPLIYQILYLEKMMKEKEDISRLIYMIELCHIDLNRKYQIIGTKNIYHVLGKLYYNDIGYYSRLYGELTKIQRNKMIRDSCNLMPNDYMNFDMRSSLL